MIPEEQVKCNICGGTVMDVSQVNQHASMSVHESNKSKLEQELGAVRSEDYQSDISVIMSWKKGSI
ncbi:MAG TPA: hypothetical protein VJ695_06150 [Nitrososphaera sp.]|nr:hypothetical protein [Nitrososphaera sp.]